ncbi:hypothetical protein [Defluviimonas sp. WL0075]|uniref:BZIP domain-containing protein n=1 Tax=Albidovulum sediminicola TaxID=2984331 RepID=A0ABT2Z7A8_9RHOB|nr:hypothetical protein [Defluviimonas sp. WL0075]MCV2866902.1 hypothetical protein [Defluviimonas sp. WL0075]
MDEPEADQNADKNLLARRLDRAKEWMKKKKLENQRQGFTAQAFDAVDDYRKGTGRKAYNAARREEYRTEVEAQGRQVRPYTKSSSDEERKRKRAEAEAKRRAKIKAQATDEELQLARENAKERQRKSRTSRRALEDEKQELEAIVEGLLADLDLGASEIAEE